MTKKEELAHVATPGDSTDSRTGGPEPAISWHVVKDGEGDHHVMSDDTAVAAMYVTEDHGRLFVAAADLLAALKVSRGQWIHSVNAEQCLAAIAKAEGR